MKNIVVTGGSGGAGGFVVGELVDRGYSVRVVDRVAPEDRSLAFFHADLTKYEEVQAALEGCDAVVHYAADPEPDFDFVAGAEKFKNNTLATYNVFNVAACQQVKKVVWASSETVLGFPFDKVSPNYFPVDEAHPPIPQNSYAMSKVLCEELARHMNRLYGVPFIALRLSNVLFTDPNHKASYAHVPEYWSDARSRMFNLWGYIDARDAALCTRLALESNISGVEEFIVAASDSIMDRPSRLLAQEVFPNTPVKAGLGEFETLLSIEKARKLLGFVPRFSWRDEV